MNRIYNGLSLCKTYVFLFASAMPLIPQWFNGEKQIYHDLKYWTLWSPKYTAMSIYQSVRHFWYGLHIMMSSNGNSFHFTGHLWGEFTGDRWIPQHKWPITRKMFPLDDVVMVSNHRHLHCLSNIAFMITIKKTSKPHIIGHLCGRPIAPGNPLHKVQANG